MDANSISTLPFFGNQPAVSFVAEQGFANRTWLVEDEKGKCVFRCKQGDLNEYLKEAWCMAQGRAHGLPVAKTIGIGQQSPWNYIVQSFKGAMNGDRYPDQTALWRWIGAAARSVNAIETQGFGYHIDDTGRFTMDVQGYARYLEKILKPDHFLIQHDRLSREQAETLIEKFNAFAAGPVKTGLSHGDLKPANVVFNQNGRITLIDWGCAQSHFVPHFEIVETTRRYGRDSAEVAAFLEGYGIDASEMARLQPELDVLAAVRLVDLIEWAARDRNPLLDSFIAAFNTLPRSALA